MSEEALRRIALQVRNWGDAFLLVAPPLPVVRAVGTPINPYAIK